MRERPILFSAPMVRAILDGRKTQTRRALKPQPGPDWISPVSEGACGLMSGFNVGGRLWVRESIRLVERRSDETGLDADLAVYTADETATLLDTWPWKRDRLPSIHMPRGLCRITLEVTGVRVERLHAITDDDAIAEGAQRFDDIPDPNPYGQGARWSMESPTSTDECLGSPRWAFANLWIKINGAESWDANPWVWVVAFRRVEALERAA
jgi:hypothetical protein